MRILDLAVKRMGNKFANIFSSRSQAPIRECICFTKICIAFRKAFVLLLLTLAFACAAQHSTLVNFSQLDQLCEDIDFQGKPCAIVHIYSDAPDYGWVDSAAEGISCVDDVARAAVVYLRASELGNDTLYTSRIRRLLNFVKAMQTEDGEFYNFIRKDLSISLDGETSRKAFKFWAARGYWALGEGYRFFKGKDSIFAAELRHAFRKCQQPLKALLANYGLFEVIHGRRYPTWLIDRYASDATSEFLLGAAAYLQAENDPEISQMALKLAEGVLAMQAKEPEPLSGAFESWPGVWHAWGNVQVQALAKLAPILKRPELLRAAELSANTFLQTLLAEGWQHEYDFAKKRFKTYPQIAYDARTTALGFLELYRATGKEKYAVLAGKAASWLTGSNVLGQSMYDPITGRGYDGIDAKGLNRNAGAESTIEALYTLIEIESEGIVLNLIGQEDFPSPN